MATLYKDGDGYKIQYYLGKRRKSIYLKVENDTAITIKRHVEHILTCDAAGEPYSKSTTNWISDLPQAIRLKLSRSGLVAAPVSITGKPETLEQLCVTYVDSRTDWKPNTRRNFNNTKRWLIEKLGKRTLIKKITPADMDTWLRWMIELGQSEPTANKEARRAREIFAYAVADRLIDENPVAMKIRVRITKEKQQYISREDIEKCINASPDAQWRLIWALTRFQGLRCPSEVLGLKWDNIDWQKKTMRIVASKTEKHESGIRIAPIFPIVMHYLDEVYQLPDRSSHIITRYRGNESNLRTQASRIIKTAGLTRWPKLFINLRASARTDAEDEFPNHVCNAWFGHCESVARNHYLTVKPDHMALAQKVQTFQFSPRKHQNTGS